jgi:hypothetical protein
VARLLSAIWLPLLTIFGSPALAAASGNAAAIDSVGVPAGFSELTRDRDMLVDVFFGGRNIGEARVTTRPGYLTFKDPEVVLALIPNLERSPELSNALAAEMPTNTALVCAQGTTQHCGQVSPAVAAIIFDEDHFRVDVFVNRKWLQLIRPEENLYLPTPTAPLSLTSSSGLALSGSTGTSPLYNFQNRTIIGYRNARLRADVSYASKLGFVADTFVAEMDRPGLRYSAGLFWAPGVDLTGQRRILGAGITTQFDTRADRDTLQGTPLVVFLSQPARVDILMDGRIVSSGLYEAGNNVIDTSNLPDGSYPLVLRVHDASGGVHDERRFFAKNPEIAPVGQPIYFAYAGMLANTRRNRPVSLSKSIFYEAGAARRLSEKAAVDLSVIGTGDRPIVEAGGWLLTSLGRLRAAALVSPRGDRGALLQVASAQTGPFSVNFDLRRIWSHDGNPLVPLSTYVDTFDSDPIDTRATGEGSFTQLSGSIGYQFGTAYVSLIGSLRKDEGVPLDYSVGPNLSWPIVSRNGLQIAIQADAQATRTTNAGYLGVRMQFTRFGYSISNSSGGRALSNRGESDGSRSRLVGDTTAHFSYADESGTDASFAGGITRELDSSSAHAEAMVYSRFGTARGEILHNIEGSDRTQYGLTLQSGAILNRNDVVLGGKNISESAVVIAVDGQSGSTEFDVLVNGQRRGRLRSGGRIPIFLEPYRSYSVTLHPVDAASVWYDSAARKVTLYPGNVQHLSWHVEHLLTVFGRAVRKDGTPVADAMVTSRRGVGQSNAQGYFQIETSANDVLAFADGDGSTCKVAIGAVKEKLDYAGVGKVLCQ